MVNIALRAARDAGKIVARAFDRPDLLKIDQKGMNDYVTNVDRQAEEIIINSLLKTYPDHNFVGEELGTTDGNSEFEWIIDPIDGTLNFVQGIPHFCIAIACRQKGKIVHGIIFDPIRQEEFVASKGQGSQLNGKRIRVSQRLSLEKSVLATSGSIRAGGSRQLQVIEHLLEANAVIRQMGSACLDLAYVASGRLDGAFLQGLSLWDMAAGSLIIREAGGLVADFDGNEKYLDSGQLITGAPKVFRQLLPPVTKAFKDQ